METYLVILGLVLLIAILFLIGIEIKTLHKNEKRRNEQDLKINDERYYELKYRIQLIITIATILLTIGGFMGYGTISSFKEEFKEETQPIKDSLSRYQTLYKKTFQKADSIINKYEQALRKSSNETNRIQVELIKLQKQYTPNIQTYIIKNIPYETSEDKTKKVYYKNLKAVDNNPLPNFTNPPIINIINGGLAGVTLVNSTTEYFEYFTTSYLQMVAPDIKQPQTFDVVVTTYK